MESGWDWIVLKLNPILTLSAASQQLALGFPNKDSSSLTKSKPGIV